MKQVIQIIVMLLIAFSALTACDSSQPTGAILKNIDFSNGKYSLYIKHKELGEFMVLDERALKENREKLNLQISIINYLPGEANRSFGVMLFKDNTLVTQKLGGSFKSFETGNLTSYAVPVKSQRMQGVKKRIQEKSDSLLKKDNIFITHQSTFVPNNRAFRFRVNFPSIAVPIRREKDSSGYERITSVNGIENDTWVMNDESLFDKQWGKKIENCIREKAGSIIDFEVSISKSSVLGDYLLDKTGNYLINPNKNMLYFTDYMYYNFTAYVMADKNNAEKLLSIDYADCINEKERNRQQILAEVKELVKQSTQPNLNFDKGEVRLESYQDNIDKYETLYEQEYSLSWLETEKIE